MPSCNHRTESTVNNIHYVELTTPNGLLVRELQESAVEAGYDTCVTAILEDGEFVFLLQAIKRTPILQVEFIVEMF